MTDPDSRDKSAAFPLLALAIGAFGIGTTEFGPMGMLPTIAQGVGVSIPTAGLLVSAYAVGVMVGAPIMTLLLARRPRRSALIALMAIFTIGNLLSALAPNYAGLLAARLLTSLNHGAFFGLGSLVAASLVPAEKHASAVAAMFMGLTVANIGGVPAATWLGHAIGWRESFAAIAGLGLIAMASLWFALPRGTAGDAPAVRSELMVLTRPSVLIALATTAISAASMFTLYTYINPSLESLAHASPSAITALLALVGIGFTIGNYIGGVLADRSLHATLVGFLSLLVVSLLAYPWLAASPIGLVIGLLVWSAAAFAVVPPLQMRVMRAAVGAPGLASSVNIGAFNLGNALGAALGGGVLNAGLGYATVSYGAAAVAAAALILVLWQAASARGRSAIATI